MMVLGADGCGGGGGVAMNVAGVCAGGTGGRTCAVAGEVTETVTAGFDVVVAALPMLLFLLFFLLTANTMTMIMMIGSARMSKPMTIAATMKPGL